MKSHEHQDAAVVLELDRLGGRGHIADIRKAAGLRDTGGARVYERLAKAGLVRRVGFNDYRLTEEGHREVHRLKEKAR